MDRRPGEGPSQGPEHGSRRDDVPQVIQLDHKDFGWAPPAKRPKEVDQTRGEGGSQQE